MNTDEIVTGLFNRFGELLSKRAQGRLKCFQKYEVQVEHWLKGELLYFLDGEKRHGRLSHFDSEVPAYLRKGSKQVDLKLTLEEEGSVSDAWIELKHWLRVYQRIPYTPKSHFRTKTWGILEEVDVLSKIPTGSKYILILYTPNPGSADWREGVECFNRNFRPLSVSPLTDAQQFPDAYFLGLLKIKEKTRSRRRR